MSTVGLLLTKNGVKTGSHAKRDRLGVDFRTRTILEAEGNDKKVQHLHLSKKSKRLQAIGDGVTLSTSTSVPIILKSDSFASSDAKTVLGCTFEDGSAARGTYFRPVWQSGEPASHLPAIRPALSVQTKGHDRSTMSMSASMASLQEAVANECLQDAPRSSKFGFKRNPGGGYWLK
mmetsp:Transcript_17719/g.30998  ORF Transcript_17719/g.30998 Transcript_17719/m.30998 type:complete len:176 (+) Transcript_17719:31-558(+)|eukprot:CAMPEP_0197653814 /NCGR_PEP_ID=MMETSP1338-20131121/37271_1 /TAXON_ID=43686 ORGANISM="Pelagodinium beii, Strain RCC1491" /NCGR_SAMPLE_ID=MMETSP1338 /ASSEMBLY_ACC=CAM_ASM_000754 /LENGTH=175 /DNA_ID=CAMNT_0043229067 /DNA_START=31 /DNA_END=558 /DNA_ORIENTATION=-